MKTHLSFSRRSPASRILWKTLSRVARCSALVLATEQAFHHVLMFVSSCLMELLSDTISFNLQPSLSLLLTSPLSDYDATTPINSVNVSSAASFSLEESLPPKYARTSSVVNRFLCDAAFLMNTTNFTMLCEIICRHPRTPLALHAIVPTVQR